MVLHRQNILQMLVYFILDILSCISSTNIIMMQYFIDVTQLCIYYTILTLHAAEISTILLAIESVDSISRDERGFPLTQYITNG